MVRTLLSKQLITLLFIIGQYNLYGQHNCEKCDNRIVYVFDMAVHAPNPFSFTPSADCDAGCMQNWNTQKEKWMNLHYASPAYKEALWGNTSNGNDCVMLNMKSNDPLTPSQSPDLYIDSKSNNWQVTTILNSGDLNLEPTYSSLPPQPDITDYLIYGILKYDTTGNQYIANIYAVNFRKKEVFWESWHQTNDSDTQIGVTTAARLAATGEGHISFRRDILPSYEKRKRDESNLQQNGIVSLKGKLKFPESDLELDYEEYAENKLEIEFTLIDCDDTPLKNKKVIFKVSEGSLEENTITTDETGRGKVIFNAPEKQCKAVLEGEWAFEYPSGRKDIASAETTIQVNKQVDKLNAQIEIKIVSKSTSPSFNSDDPEYSESDELNLSAKMVLFIDCDKVERQLKDPRERYECGKGTSCPVLGGSSYYKVFSKDNPGELDEFTRFPIQVNIDESKKAKKRVGDDTKFVTVLKYITFGTNVDEAINLNINIYYPSDNLEIPTALVPQYLVSISGGKYTDRLSPVLYPTLGDGSCQSWDDFKEALVDDETPLRIGVPYSYSWDEEIKTEEDIHTPMLINDAQGLDKWLLNPIGTKSISFKGKSYHNDSNTESEQEVFVTLSLTPKY